MNFLWPTPADLYYCFHSNVIEIGKEIHFSNQVLLGLDLHTTLFS